MISRQPYGDQKGQKIIYVTTNPSIIITLPSKTCISIHPLTFVHQGGTVEEGLSASGPVMQLGDNVKEDVEKDRRHDTPMANHSVDSKLQRVLPFALTEHVSLCSVQMI